MISPARWSDEWIDALWDDHASPYGLAAPLEREEAIIREFARAVAREAFEEAADLAGEWRFDVPSDWPQERKNGRDIAAAEIDEAIRARAKAITGDADDR